MPQVGSRQKVKLMWLRWFLSQASNLSDTKTPISNSCPVKFCSWTKITLSAASEFDVDNVVMLSATKERYPSWVLGSNSHPWMWDEMLNLIRGFYLKYWLKNVHLKTSHMARSQLYCTNRGPRDCSDLRKCVFSSLSCYVASICTKCRTLSWMATARQNLALLNWPNLAWLENKIALIWPVIAIKGSFEDTRLS